MASWAERLERRLQGAQVRFTRAQHDANLEYAIREAIEEAARRCLLTVGHGDPPEERYVAMACNKSILAMLVDDDAEAGGG